jgi:hypothetical protein
MGPRTSWPYGFVSDDAYIIWFNLAPDMYYQVRCITVSYSDIVCFPPRS